MKLFLSGEFALEIEDKIDQRLFSFFYHPPIKGTLKPDKTIQRQFDRGNKIFLDCGAFTAYTKGKSIDLSYLTEFTIKHQDRIEHAASLDVIGDPDKSYNNWKWQLSQGADVFPTFHYGEPFEFLDTLIKEADFIGIGGIAKVPKGEPLDIWLMDVWNHLADDDGIPCVDTHAFGITTPKIIKNYPWTTSDSSSWIIKSSLGLITFYRDGVTMDVVMSERKSEVEDICSRHWIYLNAQERATLQKFADDNNLDLNVEDCAHSRLARGIFNAASFLKLEELAPKRIALRQCSLF